MNNFYILVLVVGLVAFSKADSSSGSMSGGNSTESGGNSSREVDLDLGRLLKHRGGGGRGRRPPFNLPRVTAGSSCNVNTDYFIHRFDSNRNNCKCCLTSLTEGTFVCSTNYQDMPTCP